MTEKPYLELGPEEIDEIIAITTDQGPFEDDLSYLIIAGDRAWQIGMLEAEELFSWFGKFPDFDFEKSIRASTCTENRRFILWSKTGPRGIGETTEDLLTKRLAALLASANSIWGLGPSDLASILKIAEEVIQKYREPHRHYHGLTHIKHCLWELDQIPESLLEPTGAPVSTASNRKKIELAVWFHDVIYDPRSKTNESDSARYFVASLAAEPTANTGKVSVGVGPTAVDEISKMIELSNHRNPVKDKTSALAYFLDIDMAILGRPVIHYNEYAQNVRLEYSHVSDWTYAHFRKRFLRNVIAHGAFRSSYFRARYGQLADANLRREFFEQYPKWIPPWAL